MTDNKKPDDDQGSIPEVEAEIVTDDEAAAQMAAAAVSPGAPIGDPITPPKSVITPGVVLFLLFVVIAAGAFALWRMQSGASRSPIPTPVQTSAQVSPPTGVIEVGTQEVRAAPADTPAVESAPHENFSSQLPEIEQEAAKADNPVEAPGGASSVPDEAAIDDQVFLPPLPRVSDVEPMAADEVAGEAADATQALAAEVAPGIVGDDPQTPPAATDGVAEGVAAEIDGAENTGEAQAVAEAAEPMAAQDAPAIVAPPTPTDISRLDNIDIAALKDAFQAQTDELTRALEGERQRSARQAEELTALRREFGAALAERDQRAETARAALRARLDKIQNNDDASVTRQLAAAAALAALQRAAGRGDPFVNELEILARLAPGAPPLEALRPHAAKGALAARVLQDTFPAAAVDALAAAGRERATDLRGRFLARIQNLVSVRSAAPLAGESPRAIISRAEDRLDNDNLAGAIAELQTLNGAAREAVNDWLNEAERRIGVMQEIDDLNTLFLGQLPQ